MSNQTQSCSRPRRPQWVSAEGSQTRWTTYALRHNALGKNRRAAVIASDAFFRFPDSVDEAAKAGMTAFIAPGGSVWDAETIAAADQVGMDIGNKVWLDTALLPTAVPGALNTQGIL